MKNAEWMLQQGMEFSRLTWGYINGRNIVYYKPIENIAAMTEPASTTKELYSEESATFKNIILKWLDQEHEEQVITDTEREYLAAVIKPFRDRVEYIEKVVADGKDCCYTDCYIFIRFTDKSNDMSFPVFCENDMYNGMEMYKKYTPKELWL